MSTGMIEIMKVAAMNAIENSKPCDLRFGTVTSVSPLKVQITTNLVIPESLLIVPQHLTDYSVKANLGVTDASTVSLSVSDETLIYSTGSEETEPVDERTLTIYNSLEIGDKVALIRNQGAKLFYILDRV